MIEELFPDKSKPKPAAQIQEVKVDLNAPIEVFDGDISQKLQITLSRMPKAKDLIYAVNNLTMGTMTVDNLDSITKAFPVESMDDLMNQFHNNPTGNFAKSE